MNTSFQIEERFRVECERHEYHAHFSIFDSTEDHEEDRGLMAEGDVKWDGCSNWKFNTEEVMLHACSKDDLLRIGRILAACHDKAKELFGAAWAGDK